MPKLWEHSVVLGRGHDCLSANRQTLIASHTAECELYSLAEAHLLGKALRPMIASLMDVSKREIDGRLYCDNAAAIQLCVLESASWRTRHLRLRGAVVRQDLEEGLWSLTYVDGVFMPADLGTKAVGPARLEDLIRVRDLSAPHLAVSSEPPHPQVASLKSGQTNVAKALLVLIFLIQFSSAEAACKDFPIEPSALLLSSFVAGFGLGSGWWLVAKLGSWIEQCFRRSPVPVESKKTVVKVSCIEDGVQTEDSSFRDSLEPGEHGDPFPVQSEGNAPALDDSRALQMGYDMIYQKQLRIHELSDRAVQLRAMGGSSSHGSVGLGVSQEGLAYMGAAGVGLSMHGDGAPEDFLQRVAVSMVSRPPGYPIEMMYLQGPEVIDGDPQVYVDDPAPLGRAPDQDDHDSEVSSEAEEEHSSVGEWSTDSGMPRGHSSGSGSSVVGGRSVIAVSIAASVSSAQAHKSMQGDSDGSWELGLLLGLVAALFCMIGVAGTWMCIRQRAFEPKGFRDSTSLVTATPRQGSGKSEDGRRVEDESPRDSRLQSSPVVHVTVKNEILGLGGSVHGAATADDGVSGLPCESVRRRNLKESSQEVANPIGPPKGLD